MKVSSRAASRPAKARHRVAHRRHPGQRILQLGPFKIVDAYLFGEVAAGTMRGILWFAGLLAIVGVVTAIRTAANDSLPMVALVLLLIFQLPRMVLFALLMAVLFGSMQAFGELSSHGEIIAMYGGGLTLNRMLRAPLAWGAILVVVAYILQESLVPLAEQKKDGVIARSVIANIATQADFRYEDPPPGHGPLQRVIQAESFDPKTNTLVKPRVQLYDSNQQVESQISAERGVWDFNTGKWKFFHGLITSFPDRKDAGTRIQSYFDTIERSDGGPPPGVLGRGDKSMREHMEHGDYELVTMLDLRRYRQALIEDLPASTTPAEQDESTRLIRCVTYGLHDKIVTPFMCLVFVLVGCPLGIRPPRSTGNLAMGLSLMVILFYYGMWSWSSTLGQSGQGNPLVMAYISPLMTLLIGLGLLKYKKA